jgi:DNA-binding NtrC family response regulator
MQPMNSGTVVLLGTSTVVRELASVLPRFGVRTHYVTSPADALRLLQRGEADLFAVEMVAVGVGSIGLFELAEAARAKGTRIALLTSRSVMDTTACATLIGAMATLNKWMPVRVTAERLHALTTQAGAIRRLSRELTRPADAPRMPVLPQPQRLAFQFD